MNTAIFRPLFAQSIRRDAGAIEVRDGNRSLLLEPGSSSLDEMQTFLSALDGTKSVNEICGEYERDTQSRFLSFLGGLDEHGLLFDATPAVARSGRTALLELEQLAQRLEKSTIQRNPFWTNVCDQTEDCPAAVFYGLAIENYHLLFRESLFDGPALPYVASERVRHLFNAFYVSEFGHDEIVLDALKSVGVPREAVADSLPLPGTMALANALSFWSANDPLFFFATLGILEGLDGEDAFLAACEKKHLPAGFVKFMRLHSDININAEHGNLSRELYASIPFVDELTLRRLKRQLHLFFQIFDSMFTGIWKFYSTSPTLLRPLSGI